MSNLPPVLEPPVIAPSARPLTRISIPRILFGSLPAFVLKLCLVAAVMVFAGLLGQQQCWSAKVKAGLTDEVVRLAEINTPPNNALLKDFRSRFPDDQRTDAELMLAFGAAHDQDGRYAPFENFERDWQILKAHRAVAMAPEMANRKPRMVGAFWAGYVLPWASVIVFGVSAAFNAIVALVRRGG